MVEQELERLLQSAKKNQSLKNALIDSKNAEDPIAGFCKICKDNGYAVTAGELLACGQNMSDSKLRSVNGGGVNGIDGWDDAYEQFFISLEWGTA